MSVPSPRPVRPARSPPRPRDRGAADGWGAPTREICSNLDRPGARAMLSLARDFRDADPLTMLKLDGQSREARIGLARFSPGQAAIGTDLPEWRTDVLNRYDRPGPMAGEAEVKFLDGDFRIVKPGSFVRCAVTGVPIPLEELKYWDVELQEAYANPEAVLKRHFPEAQKGRKASSS